MKNVFDPKLMQEYNSWCEKFLETAKDDPNCRHPKVSLAILEPKLSLELKLGTDRPVNNDFFDGFPHMNTRRILLNTALSKKTSF